MTGGVDYRLERLTTLGYAALVDDARRLVVLVPVGSVEPHGPHMALATDTVISAAACARACALLEADGDVLARIAPPVPYGVTECAARFAGAVSVPGAVLSPFLRAVVDGYLGGGADHVCLVNNHLEPAQDKAVRAAVEGLGNRASVACPLTRRWARTLSPEFKSGACHAGRYETSIILAADPSLVDDPVRAGLPEVPISLSEKLSAGVVDFVDMGLADAYAGAPADASAAEGHDLLDRLAAMIVGSVRGES